MTDQNTNEAELLRMLGRWQDLALELGFAAGTGPAEIIRKVAALADAADQFLTFEPTGRLPADTAALSGRKAALRGALAAYRGAAQPDPVESRRSIAETLAAEHAATLVTSAKLAERIAALDAREADEHGPD